MTAGTPELTQAEIDALLRPELEPDGVGGTDGTHSTHSGGLGTIMFNTDAGTALIIHPDGRITRGEGFANDDAASVAFFEVLSKVLPTFISTLRTTARTLAAYALNCAHGATLAPFELENLTALAKQVGCTITSGQPTRTTEEPPVPTIKHAYPLNAHNT